MIMGLKQRKKNKPRIKLNANIYTSHKTAVFYLLEQSGQRVTGIHIPDDPHTHTTNSDTSRAKSLLLLHMGTQCLP